MKFIYTALLLSIMLSACESHEERQKRILIEEQQKIELEEKRKADEAERTYKLEQERTLEAKRKELERIEKEKKLEKERQEKALYAKFINNSLKTGATPYSYCYGRNSTCSDWGCSQIQVRTPNNSDVLVTIKKGEKVVKHAFIKSGSSYTFELPNGTYQPFFYYGKGWNPEKIMKKSNCGTLKGGFVANEVFGKDFPQTLSNNILQYELIIQVGGNFSTKPSNAEEAL